MAIIVRPLTARLLDSAPEQGAGLHRWLIKGARECQLSGVKPDRAFDLIAATVVARGGEIIPHSIRQAIEKAYSQPFTGGQYDKRPVWPEPDLERIEEITMERIWCVPSVLEELQGKSPEKLNKSTSEIIRRLFPADSPDAPTLIYAVFDATDTTVHELSRVAENLHKFPLLVPSPMIAKTGLTKDNRESGRCLSNTGPRRFLVTEFDFKRLNDKGERTKYADLIDLWEAHSISVQDACAAIILHLAQYGPLVMVVFSGNKSLHSWWYCAGESEDEGSRLNKFMRYAAMLGADPATYTRSQFVRMPGASRADGRKQTIHYLDTKGVTEK
jgi:hypothetical protein